MKTSALRRIGSPAGTLLSLVLLASCGYGLAGLPAGADVEGMVYSDFPVDMTCEAQAATGSRPDELSGISITFTDHAGTVLGQTSTGALESEDLIGGCRFFARYGVTLPPSSSYKATFEVPSGRESVWLEVAEQRITEEQLETAGHRWDFKAVTTFTVVDPPCAFDGTDCVTTTTAP